MRFPILAISAVALSSVAGPISAVGLFFTLAAGAASLLNRVLNGEAAVCPEGCGPLVPGKRPEGPCLVCPACEGCFDEQARRILVAVEDVGQPGPMEAGDPCPDCDEGELVAGINASTGAHVLVCAVCDARPEEGETREEVEGAPRALIVPLSATLAAEAAAPSSAPAEDLAPAAEAAAPSSTDKPE